MDAAEDAIAAARIAAAKDEDDLDSEDESYLDNEEIAHRQNMVGRTPSSSLLARALISCPGRACLRLQRDQDLLYEEDVLRNPYNLKGWWRYIQVRPAAVHYAVDRC